ncbi:hypothetical protein BGZ60DRAFT_406795 [Tricladium varicosporioides]|nr:hypothetical protein BGZ60DRAFT_406795 [Hymenoscyphus varicosporioides]
MLTYQPHKPNQNIFTSTRQCLRTPFLHVPLMALLMGTSHITSPYPSSILYQKPRLFAASTVILIFSTPATWKCPSPADEHRKSPPVTASSPTLTKRNNQDEQIRLSNHRQATFAKYNTSSHPTYTHNSTATSVQAHTTTMRAYLDAFDAVMATSNNTT